MKSSIVTKISIIFAVCFMLVCVLFFMYANIQKENAINFVRDKQMSAINYLLALYEQAKPPQDLTHYFKNFGLEYVQDQNLSLAIAMDGEVVFTRATPIGTVKSILHKDNLYLHVQNVAFNFLLENSETKHINDSLFIIFIVATILLFSLYASVLKSLTPLKKLSQDIRRFAAGNLDVKICSSDDKDVCAQADEIGEVAMEFGKAVKTIRELVKSRQLFLRAIMHELKTPIGKGRIVSEMVESETQKNRLISIFVRLEMLINEFGKIEQLLSKSYSLDYHEYHFSLILEQVADMLMLENFEDKVICDIQEDVVVKVDYQLFCLAIKNLIDNGLKYADDKKVILLCKENEIVIKNLGKALEHDIEHYMQAFVRGDSKTSGMGLGLYIIDQIVSMHKMSLKYSYENAYHCFCIKLNKKA
ncbi:MAG: ArsS family sensor histidine kinase [Campylobacter sp.]|nr:ArsS family sensor histidine kinase [Campylobacter sp.]